MVETPAWPPRSAPRLFVEECLDRRYEIAIEGNQAHYLSRVMRVKPGDTIILCDDQTGEYAGEITEVTKRTVTAKLGELLSEREKVPDFWLCPALLKKDRFDTVLEKATELGVDRIYPMVTARCVADKLNPSRAESIVIEAAEQCARTALPRVEEPRSLDALLADWPAGRTLFFADELGGETAAEAFRFGGGEAALLIGPEGGFTDEERRKIRAHPLATPVSLGPRILRGETAAIAGTAIWMAERGDWQPEE